MKKQIKLALLFMCSIQSIFAQDGSLKVGPNLNGARDIIDFKLHDNELSVMTSKGRDLNYWKLSPTSLIPNSEAKSITATKSKSGGMVVNSDEYTYFSKISLDTKEVVFYTRREGKDKTTSLYFQDLDNSYKPISKSTKLATRSTKTVKTGIFNLSLRLNYFFLSKTFFTAAST